MYAVTCNKTYYPRVERFETLPEAEAAAVEMIRDEGCSNDGSAPPAEHTAEVCIMQVLKVFEIKTF